MAATLAAEPAAGGASAQGGEGVTVVHALTVVRDSAQAAAVNSIQPILDDGASSPAFSTSAPRAAARAQARTAST